MSTEQAAPAFLEVQDLSVRYGGLALALQNLTLSVAEGSVVTVVGPNGAGKSSLARVLSGLIQPSAGSVLFKGKEITSASAHDIRRAGIVHLPEGRGVFTALTVEENLRMATSLLARSERKEAIAHAYEVFPVLGQRRRQQAGTLSGGEQQMVSLARAFTVKPQLIIADELSLGLAPLMVDVVFDSLARARDQGVTILLIEQFVHRALAFADFCIVMSRGQAVWSGPTDQAKDEVLRRFLGGGEV
jgi:branched-chain amino acid transport system ATP-binding protein